MEQLQKVYSFPDQVVNPKLSENLNAQCRGCSVSHNGCIWLFMLVLKVITLFKLAGIKLAWFTERQVQFTCKKEGTIASCGMVLCALTSGFAGE